MYNFDEVIERKGTNSYKHDSNSGLLPMWVADMDFRIPPEANAAIQKCTDHGIYGYTIVRDDYNRAIMGWFAERFGYETKPEWIVKTPGVVFALSLAVRAFTQERDAIIIQKPVYGPFESVIAENNRRLIVNSLVYEDGKYTVDFEDFERKIVDEDVRMFILCSPHNPVGRVWTKDELRQFDEICTKHNCLVISDEIHCDLIYKGYKHHVFENAVVCTAPSKTFNMPGLQNSNIFIANEDLRTRYQKEFRRTGYGSMLNIMGQAASQAVYEHGEPWLTALIEYLTGNLAYLNDFISKRIPKIKVIQPEGTYLVWLDFKEYNMPQNELNDLLINKAKVWLQNGILFGQEEGDGFFRINIGCPRSTLQTALERIERMM